MIMGRIIIDKEVVKYIYGTSWLYILYIEIHIHIYRSHIKNSAISFKGLAWPLSLEPVMDNT